MAGQVNRFHDSVALSAGTGPTVYMTAPEAERAGRALLAAARSIRRERFVDSSDPTVGFTAFPNTYTIGRVVRGEDGKAKRPLCHK
jgi:hypothetical protein